ncbi:hypothetical protein VNI00_015817 [Paramarasmius palmivorus]|uniref:Uncharacterized protein n=1 Tax=Paramarasmius palmivorus TaxID=297713 RepID=A0AAW0BIA6_9AGAR
MTEYDYSPEGYRRYLDTQDRIARWRDTTEAHRQEYSAPFGARSDVDANEQWDGVTRANRGDASLSRGIPQQSSYHTSVPVAAPRPSYANPTWVQAPLAGYQQPQTAPAPAPIIIQSLPSKHKSSKSHKSHKSSKSKGRTYVITPPPPYIQPQYAQFQHPQSGSVTYITTDYAGYPVPQTAQRHQVPGSVYSYSTPPVPTGGSSYAAPTSPVYSNPSPLASPGATPLPGTLSYPPQQPHYPGQQNVLIIPSSNGRSLKVMTTGTQRE